MSRQERRREEREREQRNRRARLTALRDQTDAATKDAEKTLAGAVAGMDCRTERAPVGDVMNLLIKDLGIRMMRRAAAGLPDQCDHLRRDGTEAAFWSPWYDRIVCAHCAYVLELVHLGSEPDNTCDFCRRETEAFMIQTIVVPARVTDLESGPAALPPIVFTAYLCPGCHEINEGAANQEPAA